MNEFLKLVELLNNTEHKTYTFASFREEDLVERSVIFSVDNVNILLYLTLTSEKFGVLTWENGAGIVQCGTWAEVEDDNAGKEMNDLLVEDVLSKLPEEELKRFFKNALKSVKFKEKIEIDFE